MAAAHADFVKNNAEYAATFGEKGALPLKPGKKLAIGEYRRDGDRAMVRLTWWFSDVHGCPYQVRIQAN